MDSKEKEVKVAAQLEAVDIFDKAMEKSGISDETIAKVMLFAAKEFLENRTEGENERGSRIH